MECRKWIFVFLLALQPVLGAGAAPAEMVANIKDLTHPASAFFIQRGAERLPVYYDMDLYNGDLLYVTNAEAVLTLRYVDRHEDTITARQSPFPISGKVSSSTPFGNFFRVLMESVTHHSDTLAITTSIRGSDAETAPLKLSMPGLGDGCARIAAGIRHPMFEWSGGASPTHVVLAREGVKAPLLDVPDNRFDPRVRLHRLLIQSTSMHFTPGRYHITIQDSAGSRVSGSFRVVDSGIPGLPSCAAEADPAMCAGHAGAILVAGGDRTLAYEAFLRLYDALIDPEDFWPPAAALADWLAAGMPQK